MLLTSGEILQSASINLAIFSMFTAAKGLTLGAYARTLIVISTASSKSKARIDKRKAWILKLRIRKPVSKFMRVCSLHFAEEDYFYRSKDYKKRKILKSTAVPLNS
ncbi:hypothetical protein NQ318_010093 [Aromia moschata]|uniref:THAP-type domain-containing protein n=1 Tax=Aromia moschata TaxID=1265417 RepID=A0AAV8YAV4_9CUCU|nr:hypothetical protein NQ318_010093 [Aromia moschata]